MTRLNIVGFESGVLASEVVSVTGSAVISTLESRSGSFSARMPGGASGSRFQIQGMTNGAAATWSAANCYVDFYIMVRSAPSALAQVCSIATATPASQVAVDMTTSRTLQLWYTNGSGVKTNIGSASSALAYNVWYRVTLAATALSTGGSSTAYLRLNGATVAQASGLTVLATPAVSAQTYWGTASNLTTDYYLDDIRIDDASEPGVSGIYFTRMRTQTGAWSAGGGAINVVEAVQDSYAPETTMYISSSTAGQEQLYGFRPFSAWFPSGTVHAVKAHVQAQESAGTTSSTSIRMQQNATDADSGGANLPGSWFWLHYLRGTAPDGTAWTMSKLDELLVGVVLNSTTATTVQVATVYCYAEMTPDDGTWVWLSGSRFHYGGEEWPGYADVFDYSTQHITSDVLGFSIQRGRTSITEEFAPGSANIVIKNSSGNHNIYQWAGSGPETSKEPFYGRVVKIAGAANGNLYGMFFGYVLRARQVHTPAGGNMVNVEAVDGLEWLRRKTVEFVGTASAAISDTIGYSATNSIGNRLGINGTNVEKLWRVDTTSRTLTRFWHQGDALTAAQKLAYESTEDWFFVDKEGHYRYRKASWLNLMGSTGSLGDIPRHSAVTIEVTDTGGYAGGKVVFAKFTTSGSTTVLYTHSGDPLPIPNGTSRIRLDYGSPAAAQATLTATTDYTANTAADGSGTNITGSVTIATTGGMFWQTGGELIVTNSSGSAGYLTFLQWRGNVITHDQSQVRTSGSEPFNTRTYTYMDSATDAATIAALLDDAPTPRVIVEMTPADADEREFALKADIGYVITPDTTGGPFPSDLGDARRVQGVRWSYSPASGHRVAWDLTDV